MHFISKLVNLILIYRNLRENEKKKKYSTSLQIDLYRHFINISNINISYILKCKDNLF